MSNPVLCILSLDTRINTAYFEFLLVLIIPRTSNMSQLPNFILSVALYCVSYITLHSYITSHIALRFYIMGGSEGILDQSSVNESTVPDHSRVVRNGN